MSWLTKLWPGRNRSSPRGRSLEDELEASGWHACSEDGGTRYWRDSVGSVLSLNVVEVSDGISELGEFSNEDAVRKWCRRLAEGREAGLIEARAILDSSHPAICLIYKRLQKPAFLFTGMLVAPTRGRVWTVVAGERGTTGVREAIITAEELRGGRLTVERYETSWAQDPYDPAYRGVASHNLRFMSDDECYDERFPNHPLTTVRRTLFLLSQPRP